MMNNEERAIAEMLQTEIVIIDAVEKGLAAAMAAIEKGAERQIQMQ